jgi:hypothetical protein
MSMKTVDWTSYTEISVVRVKQLLTENRHFQGSGEEVERPPQVGDTGTIVSVYTTPGQVPAYEVECVMDTGKFAGHTIWLATFTHAELDLIDAYEHGRRV